MFKKLSSLIFIILLSNVSVSLAGPLGTIPTIQEQNLELVFDLRSDLWTSPYTYKESPLRITGGSFRIPLLNTESWAASALIYTEALNLGRADFQLGDKSVFIGNSLRNELVGFGIRKSWSGGSSLSAFAAFATASDDPWGSPRDDYFYASVLYRSEIIDNHNWIFGVDQSGNRGFYNGRPFPYLGVSWFANERLTVAFGFPFLHLAWDSGDPEDPWGNDFRLTPYGYTFRSSKDIGDNMILGFYSAFTVRSYLYDAREVAEDRLYYQEILGEVYLSREVTEATSVTFAVGGSVDRKLYETERMYHPDSKMQTIENDYYGRISVEFKL
ncbi:hypothetical protein [Bdellovibrio sp. HCB209]|uniref:hypothetical protein n=1 Tax=Bdellovibrio sp. HCB209 TaxID=3394354 RepID=UPI0039B4AA70